MKVYIKKVLTGVISFLASIIVMYFGYFTIFAFYKEFIGFNFLGATSEFWFIGFIFYILLFSFIFSVFIAWKGKKAIAIISVLLILFSLSLLVASGVNDYKRESKYLSEQKEWFIKLDDSIVNVANNPDIKICFFDFNQKGSWDVGGELKEGLMSELNDCSKISCSDSITPPPHHYLHSSLKNFFYDPKEEIGGAYDGVLSLRNREFFLFEVMKNLKTGNLELLNLKYNQEKMVFLVLDYTGKYYFNKTSWNTQGKDIRTQFASSGCKSGIYIENQGMNSEWIPILFIYEF